MNNKLRALLCGILLFDLTGKAHASVIDQVSPNTNASFTVDINHNWQQQVTVGIAGQLQSFDIFVGDLGPATFYLNIGAPWQTDSNVFQTQFTPASLGWTSIDVSSAGLNFSVGDVFVIGLQGLSNDSLQVGGSAFPGLYAAGPLYVNGFNFGDWDIAFRTHVGESVAVSEPLSFALFGIGMAGFAFRRARRGRLFRVLTSRA